MITNKINKKNYSQKIGVSYFLIKEVDKVVMIIKNVWSILERKIIALFRIFKSGSHLLLSIDKRVAKRHKSSGLFAI